MVGEFPSSNSSNETDAPGGYIDWDSLRQPAYSQDEWEDIIDTVKEQGEEFDQPQDFNVVNSGNEPLKQQSVVVSEQPVVDNVQLIEKTDAQSAVTSEQPVRAMEGSPVHEQTNEEDVDEIDYTPNLGPYTTAIRLQQQRLANGEETDETDLTPNLGPYTAAIMSARRHRQGYYPQNPPQVYKPTENSTISSGEASSVEKGEPDSSERKSLAEEEKSSAVPSEKMLSKEEEERQLDESIKNSVDLQLYFESIGKVKEVSYDSILENFQKRDTSPSTYAHKQAEYMKQHEAEIRRYIEEQPQIKQAIERLIDGSVEGKPDLTYDALLKSVSNKTNNPKLDRYVKQHEKELKQYIKNAAKPFSSKIVSRNSSSNSKSESSPLFEKLLIEEEKTAMTGEGQSFVVPSERLPFVGREERQLAEDIKDHIDVLYSVKNKAKEVSYDSILEIYEGIEGIPDADKKIEYIKQHEAEIRRYMEQLQIGQAIKRVIDGSVERKPDLTYDALLKSVSNKTRNPKLIDYVKQNEGRLTEYIKNVTNNVSGQELAAA